MGGQKKRSLSGRGEESHTVARNGWRVRKMPGGAGTTRIEIEYNEIFYSVYFLSLIRRLVRRAVSLSALLIVEMVRGENPDAAKRLRDRRPRKWCDGDSRVYNISLGIYSLLIILYSIFYISYLEVDQVLYLLYSLSKFILYILVIFYIFTTNHTWRNTPEYM